MSGTCSQFLLRVVFNLFICFFFRSAEKKILLLPAAAVFLSLSLRSTVHASRKRNKKLHTELFVYVFFSVVVVLYTQHVRTRGITRCAVAGKGEICFYAVSNFARAFTTFARLHAEYSLYSVRALPPAGEM